MYSNFDSGSTDRLESSEVNNPPLPKKKKSTNKSQKQTSWIALWCKHKYNCKTCFKRYPKNKTYMLKNWRGIFNCSWNLISALSIANLACILCVTSEPEVYNDKTDDHFGRRSICIAEVRIKSGQVRLEITCYLIIRNGNAFQVPN